MLLGELGGDSVPYLSRGECGHRFGFERYFHRNAAAIYYECVYIFLARNASYLTTVSVRSDVYAVFLLKDF